MNENTFHCLPARCLFVKFIHMSATVNFKKTNFTWEPLKGWNFICRVWTEELLMRRWENTGNVNKLTNNQELNYSRTRLMKNQLSMNQSMANLIELNPHKRSFCCVNVCSISRLLFISRNSWENRTGKMCLDMKALEMQISFSRVGSDDEVGGCLNVSYVVNLQTSWKRSEFEFRTNCCRVELRHWQISRWTSTLTNSIERQLNEILNKSSASAYKVDKERPVNLLNFLYCFTNRFDYLSDRKGWNPRLSENSK